MDENEISSGIAPDLSQWRYATPHQFACWLAETEVTVWGFICLLLRLPSSSFVFLEPRLLALVLSSWRKQQTFRCGVVSPGVSFRSVYSEAVKVSRYT